MDGRSLLCTLSITAAREVFAMASPESAAAAAVPAASMPDDPLLAAARSRWAAHGFATRSARVNDVTLHVAQAGRGDAVMLLHGYPQTGEIWRMIGPELARTHDVIIPDLRGMGLSEVAADGYDLANVAEDIHQLVASMGYRTVRVVGHDWGGAVGAVYALRYRGEVTKLAFLESALNGGGLGPLDIRQTQSGLDVYSVPADGSGRFRERHLRRPDQWARGNLPAAPLVDVHRRQEGCAV
jgi:pimeloyl-ACP methyl ester carboxylesterase